MQQYVDDAATLFNNNRLSINANKLHVGCTFENISKLSDVEKSPGWVLNSAHLE